MVFRCCWLMALLFGLTFEGLLNHWLTTLLPLSSQRVELNDSAVVNSRVPSTLLLNVIGPSSASNVNIASCTPANAALLPAMMELRIVIGFPTEPKKRGSLTRNPYNLTLEP